MNIKLKLVLKSDAAGAATEHEIARFERHDLSAATLGLNLEE